MHPAIRRLGFQGRDAAFADSLLRSLQHRGHSEQQGVALLTAWANSIGPHGDVSLEDAALWLSTYVDRNGLDPDIVHAGHGWHGAVSARGNNPDAIAPLPRPSAAHIEKRLAEIGQARKQDLHGYFGSQAMQDEELMLLDARAAPASGGFIEGPAATALPAPGE